MSTQSTRHQTNQTAVLVIDTQVALLENAYQHDEVIATIAGLLAQARTSGVPVIYLQHDGDEDEPLAPGSAGWQIHPALAPQEGELVIRKRASDSFYETSLAEELRARGITRLVVAGLRTERCVDTTCRQAVSLGYDVILATDAHTTTDTTVLSAGQIIAHTNDNLDNFGNDAHCITILPASAIAL